MYHALCPGAIGVHFSTMAEAIRDAVQFGFEGIEVNPRSIEDLIDRHGVEHVRSLFVDSAIKPCCFGMPVHWQGSKADWEDDLAGFPYQVKAAALIGSTRCATWIPPASDERDFQENYDFTVARFAPIARILADHGCSLGLEYVGTKSLRDKSRYPFIYTLEGMLTLAANIGPNVGVLLDSWHWYTSHGTVDELRSLSAKQVVYVHVNDAPAGIDSENQQDHRRALPGETGVIDIVSFLKALDSIGYDGPVAAEPFKAELRDLKTNADRLRLVKDSLDKVWALAEIKAA